MPARAPLIALFAVMYAGFGAQSPFLSAFLTGRGVAPEAIGVALGAGVLLKLVLAPTLARFADARAIVRVVLAAACVLSAATALLFVAPAPPQALIALVVGQSAALAPLAPFADASALSAAAREKFSYGLVRGVGSAAFVGATLATGALASHVGWQAAPIAQAVLLALAAPLALLSPEPARAGQPPPSPAGAGTPDNAWRTLLAIPAFRTIMLVAALALGSHALHDGFAAVYWQAHGTSPQTIGILWSEGVVAEVAVFLSLGPAFLKKFGERSALLVALGAAVLRWSVMASTPAPAIMALTEPLHGLSFALLHLACMGVIARTVPPALAASAQSLYGAVAIGGANVILSSISGVLFARFGGGAFWFMAALALAAAPLALRLREK